MTKVKKDMLFEAIVVLLLIVLVFILYVMVTGGGPSASEEWNLSGLINSTSYYNFGNMFVGDDGTLYTVDGKSVHAIDTDGHVRWSIEIPYLLNDFRNLEAWGGVTWRARRAVTDNETLYIELSPSDFSTISELLAISPDGVLLWGKRYARTNLPKNIDAKNGLLYVKFSNNTTVYGAEGKESVLAPDNIPSGLFVRTVTDNNITYTYQPVSDVNTSELYYSHYDSSFLEYYDHKNFWELVGNRTLDQLDTILITADDAKTEKLLWNYSLPIEKRIIVVNESNYKDLMVDYDDIKKDNAVSPEEWYQSRNIPYSIKYVNSWAEAHLIPTKDVLYVSYWTYNYEVPTFFDQSYCTYADGIYAIGNSGRLIWSKTTDSRIIAIQVNNGTIYYGTENGRVSSTRIDAAAGFALTAVFYLFIRFFLAGAITRARGQIGSNVNRNKVLNFIADNPGASLYEISKRLRMNMGTVRYHLMILGLNHRITSYKADDKYVRYFTNSGSYYKEQQLVISLMRRDGINRVLNKLIEKPGLSNMELAKELGVLDSSTIRQMKELLAKGIITKELTCDGKLVYSVKNEYKEQIALAAERYNRSNTP